MGTIRYLPVRKSLKEVTLHNQTTRQTTTPSLPHLPCIPALNICIFHGAGGIYAAEGT